MPNSSKAIIDRMLHKGAMTNEEHDKILRNLPRWIPCSERLPEDYTEVIVSDDCAVYTAIRTNVDYTGQPQDHYHWEDIETRIWVQPDAWMPLPEPWKGEEP